MAPLSEMPRMRAATMFALVAAVVLTSSSCAASKENEMSPERARDALVSIVENSAQLLDVQGWTWDGAPEVGNCGQQRGERVNYTYGYGAPPPDSDHAADAQKVADYWTSLGMEVRIVDKPAVVVYATGGPVKGLSFSTAPGDYHIAGTSLCVPGDADEIRQQDNG
jgi:ABC-type transport system substrate-binding protein